MKYLMMLAVLFGMSVAHGQESCDQVVGCQIEDQDVNTPVPLVLKDAKIIVRTKDGKERELSANEFKVVKRKQQFKVTEKIIKVAGPTVYVERETIREINRKENKNLLMLGLSYDYTDLNLKQDGNRAVLYSNKGLIPDLSYLRRKIADTNFGLGVGVNTNVAPRLILGYEF